MSAYMIQRAVKEDGLMLFEDHLKGDTIKVRRVTHK